MFQALEAIKKKKENLKCVGVIPRNFFSGSQVPEWMRLRREGRIYVPKETELYSKNARIKS